MLKFRLEVEIEVGGKTGVSSERNDEEWSVGTWW